VRLLRVTLVSRLTARSLQNNIVGYVPPSGERSCNECVTPLSVGYKFADTHLYHSRQWLNIHIDHFWLADLCHQWLTECRSCAQAFCHDIFLLGCYMWTQLVIACFFCCSHCKYMSVSGPNDDNHCFLETKRCLKVHVRPHALSWFSQNSLTAWNRCRYAVPARTVTSKHW